MSNILSPFRYPGGKSQLTNFINQTITNNNIQNAIYCEPFSGGAGVAINLLLSNKVSRIILNDYDIAIYSVWYAIIFDTKRLINFIETTPVTIDNWTYFHEIYLTRRNYKKYNFALACATFFLNRTNRSGIIAGGPIGGHSQNSNYKIDCRFNKATSIKKIIAISEKGSNIDLFNLDAVDLIQKELLKNYSNQNLFTYFDPPYYKQGKNLYTNFFDDQKHLQLANAISLMNSYHWIATYDNADYIKNLYKDRTILEYTLNYSANIKRTETELFFYSNKTKVESYDVVSFTKKNFNLYYLE